MSKNVVKTYKDWEGNLDEYLKVGDRVDEEMYDHFLNILPPLTNRSDMLQVSEPYDFVDGKSIYCTFAKEDGFWIFKGHCYKGEVINRTSVN